VTARAALPMYDWPEVGAALDTFWSLVHRQLRAAGIDAPDRLTRPDGVDDLWSDHSTVVDQVCSLNPVREGAGTVVPLGTLAYVAPDDLPTCPPGDYYSVIVCRTSDARRHGGDVAAFGGARIVANGTDSQSGYWSLGHHVRDRTGARPLFGRCGFSGSHRASIRAVADGMADLAAIDVHSWRLALEHEPAAHELAVIETTSPTPGVVCVTGAASVDRAAVIDACLASAAEAMVGTPAGRAMGLAGYRSREPHEFDVVARRVACASRTPWHTRS